METRIITPKTTVADLLADYPQLEPLLIDTAPVFIKLKNPLLRRTIARVTTIAQAAAVANLPVSELVNRLRSAVGQSTMEALEAGGAVYQTLQPDWYHPDRVVDTLDVTALLDRGEQPVHAVLARLKTLEAGQVLAIKAGFLPAPLIDKSRSLSYRHWVRTDGPSTYTVFFIR